MSTTIPEPSDAAPVVVGFDLAVDGRGVLVTRDPQTGAYSVIGHTDQHADTPAPNPTPAGDILDQIDAAVDERCACGCGRHLPPDGPSAYFATPECQARWHNGQATDPLDVYRRPDAAVAYVAADDRPVPLLDAGHEHQELPDTLAPAEDNEYGTAYQQPCPHCQHSIRFQPYADDDDDCDRPSDNCRVYLPPRTCPHCTAALHAHLAAAAVHDHGPVVLFELSDGTSRVHHIVPARRLRRDPTPLIEATWATMRRDVTLFTRFWLGSTRRPSTTRPARRPDSTTMRWTT
jgi:hypothetical protein